MASFSSSKGEDDELGDTMVHCRPGAARQESSYTVGCDRCLALPASCRYGETADDPHSLIVALWGSLVAQKSRQPRTATRRHARNDHDRGGCGRT
jgi:hypothetical protein